MYVNALKTMQRANVTYFRSSRRRDTVFWRSCDMPSCIRCSSMRIVVQVDARVCVPRPWMYVWTNIGCQVRDAAHAALSNSPPHRPDHHREREVSWWQPSSTRRASFRDGSARAESTCAVLDVSRCPIMGFALRLSEKCLAASPCCQPVLRYTLI